MDIALKKGILDKELETNECICKACFKERCKVVCGKIDASTKEKATEEKQIKKQ